jgi:general secretion pathway protein G
LIKVSIGCPTGLSLVELIMTLSILSILAAIILPSAQMMAKRNKEIELRRNLRIIRNALDDFKKTQDKACEKGPAGKGCELGKSRYPESLDVLVEGFDFGDVKAEKKKFLRRIPADPFVDKNTVSAPGWGIRSYSDAECGTKGGDDVFDVCSLSDGTAIDGTKYKEW